MEIHKNKKEKEEQNFININIECKNSHNIIIIKRQKLNSISEGKREKNKKQKFCNTMTFYVK